MNIYFLRHEERDHEYVSFNSPLTNNGKNNAEKLILPPINKIYCSPFLRTIQTITPFANKNNIPIIIENGLCEYLHNKQLENIKLENNNSIVPLHYFKYPEDEFDVMRRIKYFFKHLKCEEGDNILLVSHLHIGYIMRKYFNPQESIENIYKEFNLKMGELRLLFNGKNLPCDAYWDGLFQEP